MRRGGLLGRRMVGDGGGRRAAMKGCTLAPALALVVGVLLVLSGSVAAQTPLVPGAAPHAGTVYSAEAVERFSVDLSGAAAGGEVRHMSLGCARRRRSHCARQVIVVVESCVEGVVLSLEGATTIEALDAKQPLWKTSTGFNAGYATLSIPTPQSGTLFLQLKCTLAPVDFTIAVNVDALPTVAYDASAAVAGVASNIVRARVVGTPREVTSAEAFVVASDDATVPEIWSYCFLKSSSVSRVDVPVTTEETFDDAISYIATVENLASNTSYHIVIALTDKDGFVVVAPIESVSTLPGSLPRLRALLPC